MEIRDILRYLRVINFIFFVGKVLKNISFDINYQNGRLTLIFDSKTTKQQTLVGAEESVEKDKTR